MMEVGGGPTANSTIRSIHDPIRTDRTLQNKTRLEHGMGELLYVYSLAGRAFIPSARAGALQIYTPLALAPLR